MKYTIEKVFATDTKKDGTKMINKWGKPSWRVGIKTKEHGDEWINGFVPFDPNHWEGTEQELIIEDEVYNGERRKKFSLPKRGGVDDSRLLKMETQLGIINSNLITLLKHFDLVKKEVEYPEYTGAPDFDRLDTEPVKTHGGDDDEIDSPF